jgi:hypothetical protein
MQIPEPLALGDDTALLAQVEGPRPYSEQKDVSAASEPRCGSFIRAIAVFIIILAGLPFYK